MNYHKVLEVIRKPSTVSEIVEATGLSTSNVHLVMKTLAKKGINVQSMGWGSSKHFHMSLTDQKKAGVSEPPVYRQIINLIATDEWWDMSEITAILDMDSRAISNKLRYIKSRGYADVQMRPCGQSMSYFIKSDSVKR